MLHRVAAIVMSALLVLSGPALRLGIAGGSGEQFTLSIGLCDECRPAMSGDAGAACPLCGPECPCAGKDDRRAPTREPPVAPSGAGLVELWRLLATAQRFEMALGLGDAPARPERMAFARDGGHARPGTIGQRLALIGVRTT
ncbi:MAG: hypothetical protein KF768_08450 [Phycisphaeraceae bacterium]|nr:hypothetical protein [Phycisphaeraceae bacterium]